MTAEVVILDRDSHIGTARDQIDRWEKLYQGDPVSLLTIAYVPGEAPHVSYFGRLLTKVELLGIFSHLSHTVLTDDDDGL